MEQVQNFFDQNRVPQRGVSFVKMRVKNRDCMHLTLPDGNLVPIGTHEVMIYEDNVPVVMAMVEDQKRIAAARDAYRALIVRQTIDGLDDEARKQTADPDEIEKLIEAGNDPLITKSYKHVLATTEFSMQASFRTLYNRDILPLDAAEVVERGIPEPQRKNTDSERDRFSTAVATAVAAAIATANADVNKKLEDLAESVAVLASENADLKKQIGRKG